MKENVGIKNLTPFTSDRQPTPEQKKKGWERHREAQEIADELMKIKNLSYAQLEEMKSDIKLHPDKYTVMQVKLMQYMSSSKLTVDWLDRHISKAPIQTDITTEGHSINPTLDLSKLSSDELIKLAELTNKAADK